MIRKSGERKQDLSDEPTIKVLKIAKTLIRTDWGGSNPLSVIKDKLKANNGKHDKATCIATRLIVEEQVASCRQRSNPRLNEVIARLKKFESKLRVQS